MKTILGQIFSAPPREALLKKEPPTRVLLHKGNIAGLGEGPKHENVRPTPLIGGEFQNGGTGEGPRYENVDVDSTYIPLSTYSAERIPKQTLDDALSELKRYQALQNNAKAVTSARGPLLTYEVYMDIFKTVLASLLSKGDTILFKDTELAERAFELTDAISKVYTDRGGRG